ncbi:collagen-like protein [Nostoc sp. 'Lobaria pulmonaria (5183) cyanobiont']|uniref:collagen-like protein n=1 Tax=Nostoc sp. 'Lobaria pulmonaria (5183) cyanobiont' TaxID=1618022 RepID=UPI000D0C1DFB|nr:collagen-like protein [Nostoc sp. 'Lobaria pulmonaria (5183) cyanobiont']AVH71585.1 collagen triple helix repeat protein [Nostoc sp. 'Lobaria pulmonaria (5183) cyanobiont']
MSTSNVIGSMQTALNCAGKCDCCDNLQQQINAINARLLNLKGLDENALKTSLKASLQPDILTAVAAAGVVTVNKLQPQIDAAKQKATDAFMEAVENTRKQRLLEIEARGTRDTATRAEKNAAEYARQMREAQAKATQLEGEQARLNRENKALQVSDTELRELERRNAREAERLAGVERKNAAKFNALESATDAAKKEAELAKGLSNQARNEVVTASAKASNAVTESAAASKAALNASLDANGLKQIVNGIGSRVDGLGRALATLETKVGTAITNAAKAVGISSEALAATGRLAGRILEIFQVIGTIFTLIEQLATLNVLGGRIDAVESGVVALGNDLSRVLGKLLGLQNRIGANESLTAEVKNIALNALGIGEAANLKAGAAQVTATRAQNFAQIANANAKTAQTTADGAVRNAGVANENATTAYKQGIKAEGIGEQAKRIAGDALGKAGVALTTALTAIALYQTVRSLRGLQGLRGLPGLPGQKGDKGDRGLTGAQGIPGTNGITTVVQIPGIPGRNGRNGTNGLPGRNGRNGIDVNPADIASLRALIVTQHATTRANINATTTGLVGGVKAFFTAQVAGVTTLITAIATNTYVEKALSVLTFAATVHNGLMLSNNLAQTLGTVIDQVLGFILPKGLDGTPISINGVLGKLAHEIIADTIGEANYKEISEDWAKANRIYQAGVNVFNQIGNAVGLVTAGMEVIGGNVAKIGNALKIWGVIGEKAYSWMNPQPNLKGKFFNFINTATEKANTIAMMVAIPIGISAAAVEINNSVGAVKKELDQENPKDDQGHPITDKLGNPLKWEPGVTVPDPTKTVIAQEQAKADSTNIIAATLEDIFDGSD